MGAVSNKIKGPAEFMLGSPFVKVEGKMWAHHGVPMKQNDGNTVGVQERFVWQRARDLRVWPPPSRE